MRKHIAVRMAVMAEMVADQFNCAPHDVIYSLREGQILTDSDATDILKVLDDIQE